MKNKIESRVPDYIKTLKAYEPGKPVEEVERELGVRNIVKMASNENPLGPSPKAIKAIRDVAGKTHFYPEGDCYYLRQRAIKAFGVRSEELIFGNGSNELIELLMRCLVRTGDNIVVSRHAFLVYKLVAQGMGARTLEAPAKNLGHDLDAMARLINDRTKIIFVANPNNPTGTYCDRLSLVKFLKASKGVPVVMDEAYCEFVEAKDYPRTQRLLKQFPNIFILRTFSKIYGLAGLRIGYGIGSPALVQYLNRLRQPFNVNLVAQYAAMAALGDRGHVARSLRVNAEGKKFLYAQLKKNGIWYQPTEANFILVRVGDGRRVFNAMLRHGVVVRPMDVYGLPEHIRVTVDVEKNNRKFMRALLKTLGGKLPNA
ncbi:MAG: histidinol-phosphate transaminase [Nitrospinae bacterium]|nr:histidinol-phosphate transaminase [Nitrospinota bacterium]